VTALPHTCRKDKRRRKKGGAINFWTCLGAHSGSLTMAPFKPLMTCYYSLVLFPRYYHLLIKIKAVTWNCTRPLWGKLSCVGAITHHDQPVHQSWSVYLHLLQGQLRLQNLKKKSLIKPSLLSCHPYASNRHTSFDNQNFINAGLHVWNILLPSSLRQYIS